MDYLCAKFGDFSFSRFGFIMRTDRQTESQTKSDDYYTHTTTIGVSNNYKILGLSKLTINMPINH